MKKATLVVIILGFAFIPCWANSAYDDLAKLVKSGTNEGVLIAYIDSYKFGFALTPDNIVQLKDLGASDKVITAAIEHKKLSDDSSPENTAATAAPQPSANTPAPAASAQPAAPTTVVYQTVPTTGGWVFVDGDWYWQYPTGVIVDLGWRPYYFHNHYYYNDFHGGFSHGFSHHGFGRGGRGR